MIISAFVSLAFPLFLGFLLIKKHRYVSLAFVVGGLSFFVFQVLIRLPILQSSVVSVFLTGLPNMLTLFLLALTASLFETTGRVVFIKFFMKKNQDFNTGLAHGIGHGGVEAFILLVLTYITYVVYAIMINNGGFQDLINNSDIVTQGQLRQVQDLLVETRTYIFLIAGAERVMVIILHICLSVITMYGLVSGKKIYLVYVLLIHFTVDFLVVLIANQIGNIIWAEIFLLFIALISLYIIRVFKLKFSFLNKEKQILQ
jgi:uncharacterized membrane protein YhfC